MSEVDLVIRKGKVATASDVMDCDVGVREGRIAALGAGLGKGAQEIDAAGKWVLPGGIDAHCHIDQLSSAGITTSVAHPHIVVFNPLITKDDWNGDIVPNVLA